MKEGSKRYSRFLELIAQGFEKYYHFSNKEKKKKEIEGEEIDKEIYGNNLAKIAYPEFPRGTIIQIARTCRFGICGCAPCSCAKLYKEFLELRREFCDN